MIRALMPLIAVAAAIGIYFLVISPGLSKVQELQERDAQYNQALQYARNLQQLLEQLQVKYNSLSQDDLDRLQKFLPDSVDTIMLVRNMDAVAESYGTHVHDITIVEPQKTNSNVVQGGTPPPLGGMADAPGTGDSTSATSTITTPPAVKLNNTDMSFSVDMNYDDLISFLKDLESSLRLVDVREMGFVVSDESDLTPYKIGIRSYSITQ